jgi:hypothetical protein
MSSRLTPETLVGHRMIIAGWASDRQLWLMVAGHEGKVQPFFRILDKHHVILDATDLRMALDCYQGAVQPNEIIPEVSEVHKPAAAPAKLVFGEKPPPPRKGKQKWID